MTGGPRPQSASPTARAPRLPRSLSHVLQHIQSVRVTANRQAQRCLGIPSGSTSQHSVPGEDHCSLQGPKLGEGAVPPVVQAERNDPREHDTPSRAQAPGNVAHARDAGRVPIRVPGAHSAFPSSPSPCGFFFACFFRKWTKRAAACMTVAVWGEVLECDAFLPQLRVPRRWRGSIPTSFVNVHSTTILYCCLYHFVPKKEKKKR